MPAHNHTIPDADDFDEEDGVEFEQVGPYLVLCCCLAGMEREALLARANHCIQNAKGWTLHQPDPSPCRNVARKHFMITFGP